MSAERMQASGLRATDTGKLDVLYLFARKIQWRNGNDDAGWELLCALASSDPVTRLAAEALLCKERE
jgi:hypothetical protein